MDVQEDTVAMEAQEGIVDLIRRKSLADYPPLHQRILVNASLLAEKAVALVHPFDQVRNTTLWSRTRFPFLSNIDPIKKEDVFECMIATGKFRLCGEAFRDDERMRRLMEYDKNIFSTSKIEINRQSRVYGLKEKPIVMDVMTKRYPAFKSDNRPLKRFTSPKTGVHCFTKSMETANNILIIIGSAGVFFQVLIGIEIPFYTIRAASPWVATGDWSYGDAQECRQALNNALDVVDIVIDPFSERMSEALAG